MKLIVKYGSVRANKEYKQGEVFEIDDQSAKDLLAVGCVEKYVEKSKEEVEEVIEEVKEEIEEVEEMPEPTLQWTRKELIEHANLIGIEDVEKLPNKDAILEAINDKT